MFFNIDKRGNTRIVFIFKNFVIKIPNIKHYNLFIRGIIHNLNEKIFSGSHKDLAKVYHCNRFGLFLIMEKVDFVVIDGYNPHDSWLPFVEMIEERYKDDKMKDFMLDDCGVNNWGYKNGKLLKIDYGN